MKTPFTIKTPFTTKAPFSLKIQVVLLALALQLLSAGTALATEPAFAHVVRPGETLASIAQLYYGDPRRETVLVAENGLTTQGGAAIVVGLRLVIPRVSYHRVASGETWAQIATRHFGEAHRVSALIEANPQIDSAQPDEGAELLIPYPLRHVSRQSDTTRRVAQFYYGSNSRARALRRFNGLRSRRLSRGQIVLVPLPDLLLSEEGQRIIEEETGIAPDRGEIRGLQTEINEQLPSLREHMRLARYAEGIALGNRLLGAVSLTGNQVVTIERELAAGYVALGRSDLAVEAFLAALERQPDLELDSRRTSPAVLTPFEEARTRLEERVARIVEEDAGASANPDAGPLNE